MKSCVAVLVNIYFVIINFVWEDGYIQPKCFEGKDLFATWNGGGPNVTGKFYVIDMSFPNFVTMLFEFRSKVNSPNQRQEFELSFDGVRGKSAFSIKSMKAVHKNVGKIVGAGKSVHGVAIIVGDTVML